MRRRRPWRAATCPGLSCSVFSAHTDLSVEGAARRPHLGCLAVGRPRPHAPQRGARRGLRPLRGRVGKPFALPDAAGAGTDVCRVAVPGRPFLSNSPTASSSEYLAVVTPDDAHRGLSLRPSAARAPPRYCCCCCRVPARHPLRPPGRGAPQRARVSVRGRPFEVLRFRPSRPPIALCCSAESRSALTQQGRCGDASRKRKKKKKKDIWTEERCEARSFALSEAWRWCTN